MDNCQAQVQVLSGEWWVCGASQEIKAKDGRSALDLASNDETRAMFREEDTQLVCLSVCQSTFRSSKEFLRAAFIKKNRHNKRL